MLSHSLKQSITKIATPSLHAWRWISTAAVKRKPAIVAIHAFIRQDKLTSVADKRTCYALYTCALCSLTSIWRFHVFELDRSLCCYPMYSSNNDGLTLYTRHWRGVGYTLYNCAKAKTEGCRIGLYLHCRLLSHTNRWTYLSLAVSVYCIHQPIIMLRQLLCTLCAVYASTVSTVDGKARHI